MSVLSKVHTIKPINGKILQMTLYGSDQLIVPKKQGNVCGVKGLGREPFIPRWRVAEDTENVKYLEGRCISYD